MPAGGGDARMKVVSEEGGKDCGGVSGERSDGSGSRVEVKAKKTGKDSGVVSGERLSSASGAEIGVGYNSGEGRGERYSSLSQLMVFLR